MPYQWLRLAAIVITVAVATIGLIQTAGPESLGFSPLAARWLGIASGVLGTVLGFLPRVQSETRRTTDQGPPAMTDADESKAAEMERPALRAEADQH